MDIKFLLLLCLLGSNAHASLVFSTTQVVTSADRVATFDSLETNGLSLANYSESSLSVSVSNFNYQGFEAFGPGDTRSTGFYYEDAGNNDYVSIRGTDNAAFTALDFLLGDGHGNSIANTNLQWQAFLGGELIGAGVESGVAKGSVVGWYDVLGFDELRVAAGSAKLEPGFGLHQSIAIDDLRAELRTGLFTTELFPAELIAEEYPMALVNVPEPSVWVLLITGVLGVIALRSYPIAV